MINALRAPELINDLPGGLAEALPVLVAAIKDGKVTWINEAGTQILGAKAAMDVVGLSFRSLLAPDYWHLAEEGLSDWLSENGPLPLRMRQVTGHEVDVEASVQPLDGGSTVLLVARDITEKRQAALALLERERRISAVLENIADGIIEFDDKGKILSFNASAEAIFGYAAAETLGTSIESLLSKAKGRAAEGWFLENGHVRTRATERVRSEELFALRKDGGIFPVTLTLREIVTRRGIRFVGAIRLVTERETLEQALLDTAARFRDLAESASDWFWEMDADLRYTYLSERFSQQTLVPRASIIGKTRVELVSESNAEILWPHVEDLKSHQPFKDFTYPMYRQDGSVAYFRVSGKPVFDSARNFNGYRGTGRNVTSEIEAQDMARAAETLLVDAIESISEGLAIYDADGRLVRTNSRYKEIYIHIAEHLVPGMPFEEWLQALANQEMIVNRTGPVDDWFDERRKHRKELKGSIEAELSDGKWISIAERPIRNGGIVGIHTDFTKLKHAEQALRQNAEQFQYLFESSIQGVVIHDNFKPLFVNQSLAHTFGYISPKEVLRLDTIERLFAPHERERIAAINAARLSGEPVPTLCEFQGMRKDGSLIWLEDTGSVIDWNGENVLQSVMVDISDRKQQEQALRESETRLREVIDNAPLKIGLTDNQGRYVLVNSLFARALNSEPEDIKCKTAADLFVAPTAELEAAENRQVLETNRILVRDVDTNGPEGRRFEQLVKFPITGPNGTTDGVGVMITDLTEQKRVEDHLRESQKLNALGQLAGGVAHDFNNLLMVIGGYAKRAWANSTDPVIVASALSEVVTATDKAAGLTKQLLAFGRRQALEATVFRASDVLHELNTMLRPLLGETIELVIDIADETVCVEADASLLSQALVNLAINARDAMPSGGPLHIRLDAAQPDADLLSRHNVDDDGQFIKFSVEDNGTGMDPATAARMFEPFFTTKEQGKGVGLGMAMVYGFVQQSGGAIDVASELGVGTIVSIYLRRVDKQPDVVSQIASNLASSAGETILLVEDDDALRRLAQLTLEELGYRVLVASDGVDALEIEEDHDGPIDLLLSDVVMPALGGIELARILKQTRPELKVILVSGYPARGEQSDDLEPDEFPLLHKPVALEALAEAVRESLLSRTDDDIPVASSNDM